MTGRLIVKATTSLGAGGHHGNEWPGTHGRSARLFGPPSEYFQPLKSPRSGLRAVSSAGQTFAPTVGSATARPRPGLLLTSRTPIAAQSRILFGVITTRLATASGASFRKTSIIFWRAATFWIQRQASCSRSPPVFALFCKPSLLANQIQGLRVSPRNLALRARSIICQPRAALFYDIRMGQSVENDNFQRFRCRPLTLQIRNAAPTTIMKIE